MTNLFGNHQAKSNSLLVHLDWVRKETKQLEKFTLILFADTNTSISNGNWEEIFFLFILLDIDNYLNFSIFCEFESIWLETKEHLHDSLSISLHDSSISNIVCCVELNIVILGLTSLDQHHIFHCIFDVELLNVLSKFPWAHLSIVQKILHDEGKDVTWRPLHFKPTLKLWNYLATLFEEPFVIRCHCIFFDCKLIVFEYLL